ncbi:MAG: hypothetical protein ABIB46_06950 [bacterium]
MNKNSQILDLEEKEQILSYLDEKYQKGEIKENLYNDAKINVIKNINEWLEDENIDKFSSYTKEGIKKALKEKRIEEIIDAFLDEITFGTGGIRGKVALNYKDLLKISNEGINTPILKGPNTINDIVLLLKSAGVANYMIDKNLKKVVIGFDSRVQGKSFACLIAKLFLAKNCIVYIFDEACPFPELVFAVPYLDAQIGILISASHNDKRYNGYKLVGYNGAQLDPAERNIIYEKYIKGISTSEIELIEFDETPLENLIFLGGENYLPETNYYGRKLINIHEKHLNHIKNFIMDKNLLKKWAKEVKIGYSAYYGAGRKAIPRLLKDFDFNDLKVIHSLNDLNGLFPCFDLEQQPDPGDNIAAEIAVQEFKKEYGENTFKELDILIGTDPDADRSGLIVKIPEKQQDCYQNFLQLPKHLKLSSISEKKDYSWLLLNSDDTWAILLWYRLEKEKEQNNGFIKDVDKKFIVLNHTTTDALVCLAKKYGLGVIKTWVGFAMISNATSKIWEGEKVSREKFPYLILETHDMENRSINIGAFEQSSGFTILGGPPLPGEKLGQNGHTRDKDGSLATILLAELATYAKSLNTNILELIDEKIYLDKEIGCFITYCEPIPYWGQFEGPTGLSKKISILQKADEIRKKILFEEKIFVCGFPLMFPEIYQTGKYDALHRWQGFPDEGIRFFFDKEKKSYLTIRPSGTSHCIRIHVQIKIENLNRENLYEKKKNTLMQAKQIIIEVKKMLMLK